jgi:hypothetical protein
MRDAVNVSLKAGDWVEVRSQAEIAGSLGPEGTVDGLPFMPEMLPYCGKRFRVQRFARKACIEYPGLTYRIRQFRDEDIVILEGLRCSGLDHDGCGRACVLFWKLSWLRKVDSGPGQAREESVCAELAAKVKTKTSPIRYYCQSTQMVEATKDLSRLGMLMLAWDDLRTGSRGVFELLGLLVMPVWRKATAWIPRKRLAGPLKKTPVGSLHLRAGELVEIRPASEIAQTLDKLGRNRGLICDFGMTQYSGRVYRVRNRLDRVISEPTGEMRTLQDTVILDGLTCLCLNVFAGCPRNDYMYWRELWLKRAADNQSGPPGENG